MSAGGALDEGILLEQQQKWWEHGQRTGAGGFQGREGSSSLLCQAWLRKIVFIFVPASIYISFSTQCVCVQEQLLHNGWQGWVCGYSNTPGYLAVWEFANPG